MRTEIPLTVSVDEAREMGIEVYGPDEAIQIYEGLHVSDEARILPFSRTRIKLALQNGQVAVWHPSQDLNAERLQGMDLLRVQGEPSGRLYLGLVRGFFRKRAPESEQVTPPYWSLMSTEIVEGTGEGDNLAAIRKVPPEIKRYFGEGEIPESYSAALKIMSKALEKFDASRRLIDDAEFLQLLDVAVRRASSLSGHSAGTMGVRRDTLSTMEYASGPAAVFSSLGLIPKDLILKSELYNLALPTLCEALDLIMMARRGGEMVFSDSGIRIPMDNIVYYGSAKDALKNDDTTYVHVARDGTPEISCQRPEDDEKNYGMSLSMKS